MLGVLVAFEIGVRLLGYQPLHSTYSEPSMLWRADSLLGWSHEPGSSDVFVGPRPYPIEFRSPVSINAFGLRGPEIAPLPEGGKRVMLLGDSVVASFEVAYENTFGAHLEPLLSAAVGAPVQVLNAGVRGYGTDQSFLYYQKRGRALEPDLVILHHTGNDFANNITLHRMRRLHGKPAFALAADGGLELRNSPTPEYERCSEYMMSPDFQVHRVDGKLGRTMCRLQLALFDRSAGLTFFTTRLREKADWIRDLYHLGSTPVARGENVRRLHGAAARSHYSSVLTTAIILALAEEVQADGARFMVIGVEPGLENLDRRRLEAAGVALHGVMPAERKWLFENDGHYNPAGHATAARRLGPAVVAQLRSDDTIFPHR